MEFYLPKRGRGRKGLERTLLVNLVWQSVEGKGGCVCVADSGKNVFMTTYLTTSTQEYKWVHANCLGNLTNCGGMTCQWTSFQGEQKYSQPLHATETGDKLRRYRPVGSKASFFVLFNHRSARSRISSFFGKFSVCQVQFQFIKQLNVEWFTVILGKNKYRYKPVVIKDYGSAFDVVTLIHIR